MIPPYQAAAEEIFRDVVTGPESSGVPEILAILKRHFDPVISAGKPVSLADRIAEMVPEDEDGDEQAPHRSKVIRPF